MACATSITGRPFASSATNCRCDRTERAYVDAAQPCCRTRPAPPRPPFDSSFILFPFVFVLLYSSSSSSSATSQVKGSTRQRRAPCRGRSSRTCRTPNSSPKSSPSSLAKLRSAPSTTCRSREPALLNPPRQRFRSPRAHRDSGSGCRWRERSRWRPTANVIHDEVSTRRAGEER